MKRLNITVPDDVYHLLLTFKGKGQISSFLSDIARRDLSVEEEQLAREYREAAKDPDRIEMIADWDAISAEGWE